MSLQARPAKGLDVPELVALLKRSLDTWPQLRSHFPGQREQEWKDLLAVPRHRSWVVEDSAAESAGSNIVGFILGVWPSPDVSYLRPVTGGILLVEPGVSRRKAASVARLLWGTALSQLRADGLKVFIGTMPKDCPMEAMIRGMGMVETDDLDGDKVMEGDAALMLEALNWP